MARKAHAVCRSCAKRSAWYRPALQEQHSHAQTGLETMLSGLYGTIGMPQNRKPPAAEDCDMAMHWLDFFGIGELAARDVTTLSYGQLRKLLIARAMITSPPLLLLDEPLAGLDGPSRQEVSAHLLKLSQAGTTLVCVTHYPHEVKSFASHVLALANGRVSWQGPVERFDFA